MIRFQKLFCRHVAFVLLAVIMIAAAQASSVSSEVIDLKVCRENIQQAMCLLSQDSSHLALVDRPCLSEGARYTPEFEVIYDNYPIVLQATFCSIDRIYIEPDIQTSAYANFGSRYIGVKQELLDLNISLEKWASWRDQLSFSGVQGTPPVTKNQVIVTSERPQEAQYNDFLFWVVAHELAHLLDFANHLNEITRSSERIGAKPTEGSFAEISWETIYDSKPSKAANTDEFHLRTELCFYSCETRNINPSNLRRVYLEAYESSFISLYASQDPWEDFAETLAFVVLIEYLGQGYSINVDGIEYDLVEKIRSERFSSKRQFIINLLSKRELKFP